MRLTTSPLVLTTASFSAAFDLGRWHVTVTENSTSTSLSMTANYTSEAYPDGLMSTCVYDSTAAPVLNRCDRASITMKYDGDGDQRMVHISQGIPKPNPMTVFGDEVFALTEDLGDGRVRGEATVKVTRAIA